MTEQQKSRFCDEYCKHKEFADNYVIAAKNCSNGKALQNLIEYSQKRLSLQCEKCILNEVSNE